MRHDDDDDVFDENGLLRDGATYHVPVSMRDALPPLQRAVANLRVVDGSGGTQGLSRPGFRLSADDVRKTTVRDPSGRVKETWEEEEDEPERETSDAISALDAAYASYERDLVNAYKRPAGLNDSVTDALRVQGYEPEKDDEDEDEDDDDDEEEESRRRVDARSVQQLMQDHRQRMDDVYGRYDQELSEAWRSR
jgi:hypothetical protein